MGGRVGNRSDSPGNCKAGANQENGVVETPSLKVRGLQSPGLGQAQIPKIANLILKRRFF